ncbi:MAG: hypothetical protein D6766_12960, partial [Verrucomicrobia bacterium]
WLLRFAVIAFVIDVGVRRIDIDREEWLKATATLRRIVFFWKKPAMPVAQDESLAALLARREQVRARHAPKPQEPAPELFKPKREAESAPAKPASPKPGPTPTQPAPKAPAADKPDAAAPAPAESVTARLLAAKRKAARRIDRDR